MHTMLSRARLVIVAALVALTLVAGGCTTSDDESDSPPPRVTLSMTQLLPFEGSRTVLLRVDNDGDEPITVTGAGISWSGYAEQVAPKDDPMAPGERLDLRLVLPPERCDTGEGTPMGVLRTTTGTVEQPLDGLGKGFVRRLWARRCFVRTLRDEVSVRYGEQWRRDRAADALVGELVVTRRAAGPPLHFTRAAGSVLHRVTLPRPVTMPASRQRTSVPVEVRPNNRCDEHAIGQATAPYAFKYGVEIGTAPEDLLVLTPPLGLQEQIIELLLDHCRREGGLTR